MNVKRIFGKLVKLGLLWSVALGGSACVMTPKEPPTVRRLETRLEQSPELVCREAALPDDWEREVLGKHALVIDRKGSVENFERNFKSIMAAYADFQRGRGGDPKKNRILIYVNGGMNPQNEVMEQAAHQIPCMKRAGYFPIFMIWRTGGLETYGEQVASVRNGELQENPITYSTAPLHVIADVGSGIVRSPLTFINQFSRFSDAELLPEDPDLVEKEREFTLKYLRADEKYDPRIPVGLDNNVIFEPDVDVSAPDPVGSMAYFFMTPFRIVTTPLLDSLGTTAWENMNRRARVNIRKPKEFRRRFQERVTSEEWVERARYPKGTGAFSKFFQELEYCLEGVCAVDEPGRVRNALREMRLTVIGHSMGTIVLNELIELYPGLPYENVVYMGSAARIGDFNRVVRGMLNHNGGLTLREAELLRREIAVLGKYEPEGTPWERASEIARKRQRLEKLEVILTRLDRLRFYNLMLHPRAEARELSGGGLVLSGSLLEWIDDMYENPRTMLDRTLGKWRNVRVTRHIFPEEAQKRMIFKIFGHRQQVGEPGDPNFKPGDPVRHGEFNDTRMHFWLPEFWGEADVNWDR